MKTGFISVLVLLLAFASANGFVKKNTGLLESSHDSNLNNFHVSDKWPECSDVFMDIQDQGNCNGSWAISVASSIRDRRCIKYGLKNTISAWDILSCSDGSNGNGCDAGPSHDDALEYFLSSGAVTGGAYGSDRGCKPYALSSNDPYPFSTNCEESCRRNYRKTYSDDKQHGTNRSVFSLKNEKVKLEITKNGPLVAEFMPNDDFINYTGGIYECGDTSNSTDYLYYAKILGWEDSAEHGTYWIAAASFGKKWGENGTFKIRMVTNKCDFEASIMGASPLPPSPDSTTTTTTQQPSTSISTEKPSTSTSTHRPASTSTHRPTSSSTEKPSTSTSTEKPTTSTSTHRPTSSSTEKPSTSTSTHRPTSTKKPSTSTSTHHPTSTPIPRSNYTCQSIRAVFNGTFQNPINSSETFNAQFQIKIKADTRHWLFPKIYFTIEHWNSRYLSDYAAFFKFFTTENSGRCHPSRQTCTIPNAKDKTSFGVSIYSYTSKWFFFDILSFPEFFDSFILTQTIGVCTDEALDFASSPPNPFLYRYCVCCGDYKPDAALNCPIKSWK